MPAYEDISIDLEHEMTSVDDQYEKLTTELSRQRREIHREVDNAIHQMEMEIGEMRLKHRSILKKHLDEVKELLCLLQQTRLSLNELEGSNEFLQIFTVLKSKSSTRYHLKFKYQCQNFHSKTNKERRVVLFNWKAHVSISYIGGESLPSRKT